MRRTLLNDGWTVRRKANGFDELGVGTEETAVTLPHDALLGSPRSPAGSPATGYYTGGAWEYRRVLERPRAESETAVLLEFEGVYRDALVLVNDNVVAQRPNGYAGFRCRSTTCCARGRTI